MDYTISVTAVALTMVAGMFLGAYITIKVANYVSSRWSQEEELIDAVSDLSDRIRLAIVEHTETGDYHKAVEAVLEVLQEEDE